VYGHVGTRRKAPLSMGDPALTAYGWDCIRTGLVAKELHEIDLALVQRAEDGFVAGAARTLQAGVVKKTNSSGGAVRGGEVAELLRQLHVVRRRHRVLATEPLVERAPARVREDRRDVPAPLGLDAMRAYALDALTPEATHGRKKGDRA